MKRILFQTIAMFFIIVVVASCQYKFIVEPEIPPPDPEDTVSFSLEVVPIWSDQGCTACHGTGGQKPDLTSDNAYNSLTTLGLYDTGNPEGSKIYYYPLPDGNHYKKYTALQASVVLRWIEEGAKNN